ncbi:MAG: hypothetical protein ACI9ES_002198 [Oceanospirillaceae bacterium]|jgi:hypothetical protein
MITRFQIMKAHALLAAFIFPVAIMFVLTGALYTWGLKGSYSKTIYDIQLTEELQPELTTLLALAIFELDKLELSYPSGDAKVKNIGHSFMLEWTGSSKDINLEPIADNLMAKLTVKETSWYRNLVQLHKAKGGIVFKIYAAVFAIALGLILISGFMMAWQVPKLKKLTMSAFLAGIGSFLAMIWLS